MAIFFGEAGVLNSALFAAAENVPMLMLELCGMICLWTGLMKIAEASGLVKQIGKLLAPLVRLLFPDVPKHHPAFSSIVMNMAANFLGIGNAATPFGLKAMQQLQEINPDRSQASPAMVTFLAVNTSCITLMPTMVISLRAAAGSSNPTAIVGATILASSIGFVFALLLDRLLRFIYYRR